MRKITIIISVLLFAATLNAQDGGYVTNIEVQKNEYWWGVYTADSPAQPFSAPFSEYCREGTSRIPLLLSSNGRIIRSEHPIQVEFDGTKFTVTSSHGKVEAESAGRTLRDAYLVYRHRYCPPSGSSPSTELFSSIIYDTRTALGQAQGEQEMLDYASSLLAGGYPTGIIVIPDGWRSLSAGLVMDDALYPDPKGMMDKLHEMGFRVMLTVTPYAPAAGKNYAIAYRSGWLADKAGTLSSVIPGSGDGAAYGIYDMTQDRVASMFKESMASLPFTPDLLLFDSGFAHTAIGGDPSWEGFIEGWVKLGMDAGAGGIVACPVGDTGAEWCEGSGGNYCPVLINNLIATGLTGSAYSTGAFPLSAGDNDLPASLSLKVLSLCMPLAVANIDDPRAQEDELKRMISFRLSLSEYMKELVSASAKSGEPLVRHMEYQFPKSGFADCNDQFMLGPKYMFAPVIDGAAKRMVRIPKGNWTDGNGKHFKGPRVIEIGSDDPLAGCFESGDK